MEKLKLAMEKELVEGQHEWGVGKEFPEYSLKVKRETISKEVLARLGR